MIFSSHRFGNLTRHADVILWVNILSIRSPLLIHGINRFMRDSLVQEIGTHESLIAHGGEYAKVYNLQACAFLFETQTETSSLE